MIRPPPLILVLLLSSTMPFRMPLPELQIAAPIGFWDASALLDITTGLERTRRLQRAAQLQNILSNLGPAIIIAGQELSS